VQKKFPEVNVESLSLLNPFRLPDNIQESIVSQFSQQLALRFNLPPRGAPGKRRSAGTRDCFPESVNQNDVLTALVPKTNLGLTIAERPTFWFYVPYASNSILSLEFSLLEQGKAIYNQTFPLTGTPGIVSIRLPETVPPLAVEELYTWRFKVQANCQDGTTKYEEVDGKVKRVALSPQLKDELEKATPSERTALYAENGLWFDTLTTLIELRRTKPKDKELQTDWIDLLRVGTLEELMTKPIVSCCSANQ
jgi:hypothetical protein